MPKELLGGKIKEHVRNHSNGQAIDRSIIHYVQIFIIFHVLRLGLGLIGCCFDSNAA